ncbi:Methyltransferase domain-containing protein [Micrococcales bacterium KH10]|nr:Methyltransferase domain-containing protein [Micrococcales bacterium KH10]
MADSSKLPQGFFGYHTASSEAAHSAGKVWWDRNGADYLDEHGDFLGDTDFCWCPEGLRESDAALLGPLDQLASRRVLEIGAGAAQCSRWLAEHGVSVVATDISSTMVAQARLRNDRTGIDFPLQEADARDLPFGDSSFDVVFTAYGALPFVSEHEQIHREAARVLRSDGRWVFSVSHPIRWAFPDVPGEAGLTANRSYFDTTPYIETDDSGNVVYAEHHRTLGDQVRALRRAGFHLVDIVEPEWPSDHTRVWGGWSPLRGKMIPGTAIFVAEKI